MNEHTRDYGKDYLVEIGEDGNGQLTGTNFFVQLKGQRRVKRTADKIAVLFSLESKHARYYSEKVKDLPVFLVVVDIGTEKGWWLFLQQSLQAHQKWKTQKSFTVKIPVTQTLGDIPSLRQAIERAQTWMRVNHPVAIQDAINAHKQRVIQIDLIRRTPGRENRRRR